MQNKPTLDDVMLAILAMDSYARGDRFEKAFTNIDGTELQTQIGKAIVRDERGEILDGADTAGFNASAYNLDDAVVISYRGTDFVDGLPNFRDVGFGWTGSIGFSLGDILEPIFGKVNNALENILGVGVGDQVISAISGIGAEELQKLTQESLALQFYEEVTGNDAFDRENANVVLTGHSLGGSLAGAVSSISGNDAVVFNEIPFTIGALRAVISENTDRLKNATADVGGEAIINFIESLITGELILPEGINADIFAALPIADNVTSFQTTGEIAEMCVIRDLWTDDCFT